MRQFRMVVLALSVLGCTSSEEPYQLPAPPVPQPSVVLTTEVFDTNQNSLEPFFSGWLAWQPAGLDLHMRLHLSRGGYPSRFATVTTLDYGDSTIIRARLQSSPFAAQSKMDATVIVHGVSPSPKWVRFYLCEDMEVDPCRLLRDTVLFAPYPGRRPSGWVGTLPLFPMP